MRPRRSPIVEQLRAVLRVAGIALILALLLPRSAKAQGRVHFNIATPAGKVSPMYTRISEFIPDAKVYERWWREIADCQGLPLPVQHLQIKWVQINAVHFYDADYDKPDATGLMYWDLGKSYLELGIIMIAMPYRYDEEVIKHEMTHFLMVWAGEKPGHSPLHYSGACGVYPRYQGGPYVTAGSPSTR
jgi:hypothetical protein